MGIDHIAVNVVTTKTDQRLGSLPDPGETQTKVTDVITAVLPGGSGFRFLLSC